MKNLYLIFLGSILLIKAHAQTDGPRSATIFANMAITGADKSWNKVNNIANSDNSYAQSGSLTAVGNHTDYLVATGFNFAIPAGVTISGIVAEVERSDPNNRTSDYSVRIVKGGAIGSMEHSGGAAFGTTDSYQLYGNAGDLWGETWGAADINSAGFGLAIAAQRTVPGGNTSGQIDHIRIIVFYNFTTLPVILKTFSAAKQDEEALIKWTTTDESNMSHYAVERSANGRDFLPIYTVQSQNSNMETSYTFVDTKPLSGTSWYRLKMVGNSGEIRHSTLAAIQFEYKGNFGIYPTLLLQGQMININNPANEKMSIRFFSSSGQLVGSVTTISNQFSSSILHGQKGMLFYQIFTEHGKMAGNGRIMLQ